jgi:gliding motility-associated-like protein
VTDVNGCQTTLQVTVNALNSVVADAGLDQNECSNVSITLDGSNSQGGTSFEWRDEGNNVVGNALVVPIGTLPPGVHTFTLTVTDGPCSATDQVQVTIFTSPDADAGADQTIFVQGTVTLGGQPSGPPGSTFTWEPDSLLDQSNVANPVATVVRTTWFVLTVVDPDGCSAIDSVLITVVPEVDVPSGFSPNGDGHNDVWQIDFIDLFPDCEVEIFNRWGEPLFKSVGYKEPWDGKYNGGFVPVGTYYYAINLNDPRFPEALTGPLTVIR